MKCIGNVMFGPLSMIIEEKMAIYFLFQRAQIEDFFSFLFENDDTSQMVKLFERHPSFTFYLCYFHVFWKYFPNV